MNVFVRFSPTVVPARLSNNREIQLVGRNLLWERWRQKNLTMMTYVLLFLFDQKVCRALLELRTAECRIEGLCRTIKIKIVEWGGPFLVSLWRIACCHHSTAHALSIHYTITSSQKSEIGKMGTATAQLTTAITITLQTKIWRKCVQSGVQHDRQD